MPALLVIVAVFVAVVVARWLVAYLHFRRLELAIPGPASLPILGNSLRFAGSDENDVVNILKDLWGGRSEMSRIAIGPKLLILVQDPDDVEKVLRAKETQDKAKFFYPFLDIVARDGLITANGETWRTHRRAFQPAFHPDVLDSYQDVFTEECIAFCGRVKDGVSQDVIGSLRLVLTKAFMRTAMMDAVSASGEEDTAFPVILKLLEVFPPTVAKRAFRPWLWPDCLFGLSGTAKTPRGLLDTVNDFGRRTVFKRRAQLAEQRGTEGKQGAAAATQDLAKEKRRTLIEILLDGTYDGLLISDEQIVEEIKTFFGAAVETSLATLGWTFKVLSLRQDIQDRLVEEAERVRGEDDAITSQHVARLEYTERVLKETLRLLPALPAVARNVSSDFVLNDKTIPKDSTIAINIYGAHRDPRHWEEPLKYDPDRFLPERSVGRHRYAYLPFSVGPRNCIGGRYAMTLMKTLLASVMAKYRVDPVDDGHTDPSKFPMTMDIATRMPGGVHVVLNRRAPRA